MRRVGGGGRWGREGREGRAGSTAPIHSSPVSPRHSLPLSLLPFVNKRGRRGQNGLLSAVFSSPLPLSLSARVARRSHSTSKVTSDRCLSVSLLKPSAIASGLNVKLRVLPRERRRRRRDAHSCQGLIVINVRDAACRSV